MMEDFHDSAQRAGGAFDVAASVEAEARATGRGGGGGGLGGARARAAPPPPPPSGATTPQAPTGAGADTSGSTTPQAATGGRHVGLGDSTRSHRRGAVPSGSRAPLATPPPSWQSEDAITIHATRHVPDPPHEGCTRGSNSGEEEGAQGTPTTDETRSYLDLYLDTFHV
jgi:hypothetical protein